MQRVTEPRFEIRCLGNFALLADGVPVKRWNAGRARSLFEFLLVNRNFVVLKERLEEVVWPSLDQAPGPTSLKVMVHGVRRRLEALTGPGSEDLAISYQDHGYMLHVSDRVLIDFDEFERLADAGRLAAARGENELAIELYQQAMTFYRGDFLAGGVDEWILDQREWLHSVALRVTDQLARYALEQSDLDAAMQYSRRTLDIDPSNEDAYRALMFVHARRGELYQVKRWHQLCTQRLRQLDVSPAPVTNHLLRKALRGEQVELDLVSRGA